MDTGINLTMKCAADKSRIIETRNYPHPKDEMAEMEVNKTRTWSLSDDKKTLIILDDIQSTAGNTYSMLLIHDRQ